jgi:hypothetical protein
VIIDFMIQISRKEKIKDVEIISVQITIGKTIRVTYQDRDFLSVKAENRSEGKNEKRR